MRELEDIDSLFCEYITLHRNEQDLNRRALADKAGVSEYYVEKIERSAIKVPLHIADHLLKGLKLTFTDFDHWMNN